MSDARYEILYDEVMRQLDTQQKDLDQLRSRAAYLLSAIAVATTFLGANVVRKQRLETLDWIALACFVAGVLLAGWLVVVPTRKWSTGFDPRFVYANWLRARHPPMSADEMRVELVHVLKDGVDRNARKMTWLRTLLGLAGLAVTAEIVLWIVSLTNTAVVKGA
jgi:hypothetical protein